VSGPGGDRATERAVMEVGASVLGAAPHVPVTGGPRAGFW
jgi:hypothetical protein